ncbi:hypothetical protein DPSP01_003608 [Paraphaeosphaeria sporulosa]
MLAIEVLLGRPDGALEDCARVHHVGRLQAKLLMSWLHPTATEDVAIGTAAIVTFHARVHHRLYSRAGNWAKRGVHSRASMHVLHDIVGSAQSSGVSARAVIRES